MSKKQSEYIQLEVPAHYKYLNVVTACVEAILERAKITDDREAVTYNVALAVHETCTNIIEHAYQGRGGRIQIRIVLEELPCRIMIDLVDSGEAFDWAFVEAPDLDTPQEGNYGLFLATTLMDEVVYKREGETNQWHLVKRV